MGLRKKILLILMSAALCFSATACFGDKDNNAGQNQTDAATENQTEGYRNDVSCADLEAAVAAALGENYWPQEDMPGIEDIGITSDMYTEYVYKAPMISANVDTLIIVRAAENKTADVKAALEAYRDSLINDTLQYPMNISKVQNSVIEVYGDYVSFIQLGADLASNASEEAFNKNQNISEDELTKIEADIIIEQNQKAAEAIKEALTSK